MEEFIKELFRHYVYDPLILDDETLHPYTYEDLARRWNLEKELTPEQRKSLQENLTKAFAKDFDQCCASYLYGLKAGLILGTNHPFFS